MFWDCTWCVQFSDMTVNFKEIWVSFFILKITSINNILQSRCSKTAIQEKQVKKCLACCKSCYSALILESIAAQCDVSASWRYKRKKLRWKMVNQAQWQTVMIGIPLIHVLRPTQSPRKSHSDSIFSPHLLGFIFVNTIYIERNMRRILESTKRSEKEQLTLLCVVNNSKKHL